MRQKKANAERIAVCGRTREEGGHGDGTGLLSTNTGLLVRSKKLSGAGRGGKGEGKNDAFCEKHVYMGLKTSHQKQTFS